MAGKTGRTAQDLIRDPWWGVVALAISGTLFVGNLLRDVRELQAQALTTHSQVETINGLARLACRQNRADAVLSGLRCDQLLGLAPSPASALPALTVASDGTSSASRSRP